MKKRPPPAAPPEPLTVTRARELVREAGLRGTTCRVAVLQRLSEAERPLSHAEVCDILAPLGFDKSTIYRCLVELAEADLATRLDAGDHVWRFEFRRGDCRETIEHPHFLCVDCGKLTCLNDMRVTVEPRQARTTVQVGDVTEVLLRGHCPSCR